jgi:cytochrome c-type biogenesis protein CcmH/NrfG
VSTPPPRGLPARIAIPIYLALAGAFLALMVYFLTVGLGNYGSVLGSGQKGADAAKQAPQNTNVQGGPPPAVMAQVASLRARIAAHPNDDVSLTQLGDMFLAVGKYADAIPLYKRALAANPKNVAASTGLDQATAGLKAQNS